MEDWVPFWILCVFSQGDPKVIPPCHVMAVYDCPGWGPHQPLGYLKESLLSAWRGIFTNHSRASVLVRPAFQVLGELVAMVMGTHLLVLYVGRQQMAGCIGTAGPGVEYPRHRGVWTPRHP